jgi:tetrahydromethanopterin S-methyltransferase subunit G
METAMSSWNDDRLDELSRRTDAGFAEMRQGFAKVDERFERLDERFERLDERFERIEGRFERLNHILLGLIGTILAATLTGMVGLIVAL